MLNELQIEITAADVDPVYLHIDHAQAIKLLERARLALFERIGFSQDKLIAQGLFPVITAVRVSYKRELLIGTLTVTCDSWRLQERTFIMSQRIVNARGKDAVTGEVEWMLMDGPTKRGVYPPAELIAALERVAAPVTAL